MGAPLKKFKVGWFGDQGLGEKIIQLILSGKKTATTRPVYDPWDPDAHVGQRLDLIDKHGYPHGVIELTRIETRPWSQFDEAVAAAEAMTLDEMRERLKFANAHDIRPDEELRIVHFRLISRR